MAHGGADRSQALLEFALALPILLALLFGIIDLAALFQAWLTVENIARQTVRYAVTGQYDPSFCVDGPDDGTEACAGDGYEAEQDAARLLSVKAYADRQTVALFYNPSATQPEIGYLHVTVCSSRDADGDGAADFTYFAPSRSDYADCQQGGVSKSDAGGPGDRVIIAVDFNHPYITPFLNQIWPMTHLFSSREGIVEQFRVPRLIALPPQFGLPTLTPSNTPPPTATETATITPTATNTPLPVHIEFVSPDEGQVITSPSQTPFEALAWNPPYGSSNGDGISNVRFWFDGPGSIPGRQENIVAYCAFGGDRPCSTLDSVVNYQTLPNGTYTIYARALGIDGRYSETISRTFILNFPPTPTPTITDTPTATPFPSCNDVFITLVEVRNNSSSNSELRVTVRNNNQVDGILTSSQMTWDSPYSPPLYFDYFWFLNSRSSNRYYDPSGSWYDSAHPTISWSNPAGAPSPLAHEAKTIWGARFNPNGAPTLAGNFNVWLTFSFPVLGDCAVSTTLVQPTPTVTPTATITRTPTITLTPSRTLTPSKTPIPSNTPIPSKTLTPSKTPVPTKSPTKAPATATNTKKPTSTPRPATPTYTPTPSPTICFDC